MRNLTNLKNWLLIAVLLVSTSTAFALSGTGTEGDPYTITSYSDFIEFANPNFAATYWATGVHTRLDTDIDLDPNLPSRTNYTTAVIAPDTDPCSDFQGKEFQGVFCGNDHKIENLVIDTLVDVDPDNDDNDYLGLFGITDANSVIKNLKLKNCTITCEESYHIGGLIGENYGLVMNCSSSGNVACWGNIDSEDIGGLVGYNNFGTITRCYSSVDVDGEAWNSGSLAGKNGHGIIDNCYATGSVTAYIDAGGLVGENEENGLVKNCYSTGVVTGTISRGGLIGNVSTGGSTQNSFWDTLTSNQTTSAGGTGKTTVEMKQKSTFTNWDFTEDWGIEDNQTYPFLKLTYPVGDLNLSKDVNLADLTIMAYHWLEGTSP